MLGKLDEAVVEYDLFLKEETTHSRRNAAILRMAQIEYSREKWAAALARIKPLDGKVTDAAFVNDLSFLKGACNFRLENWAISITALKAFLEGGTKEDPRLDTVLIELAIANVRSGNVKQARVYLDKLVAEHPKSVHRAVACAELGRICYESGEYAAARKALELCIAAETKGPQRPKAEYYLGWVAMAEKDEPRAIAHFKTVVTSHAAHRLAADSKLQLGLLQFSGGKYAEAKSTLESFTKENPKHAEMAAALYALGVAKSRSGDNKGAVATFRNIVDKYPDAAYSDRALYEWAWCEKELKHPAEALKLYERFIGSFPKSPLAARVKMEMAELSFAEEDYDKVIAQLEAAMPGLTDAAVRAQAQHRLGMALFNKGQFERSAPIFETLVKEHPESELIVSARYHAGESRLKLHETIAARDHFSAVVAMKAEPDVIESALLRLGETQTLTKQWPEAEASYRRFLDSYPKSRWLTRARFGYALACEKQERRGMALTEYRAVVAGKGRDELSARSQFQIGECLFAMKQYDDAIREFVRVTVNYGHEEWSARALLEMGRVLEAKGDTPKAMDQFREVVEKYPESDTAVVAKQRLDVLRRKL